MLLKKIADHFLITNRLFRKLGNRLCDFIPKNKLLFSKRVCGEEGSEIELFWGGFGIIFEQSK